MIHFLISWIQVYFHNGGAMGNSIRTFSNSQKNITCFKQPHVLFLIVRRFAGSDTSIYPFIE